MNHDSRIFQSVLGWKSPLDAKNQEHYDTVTEHPTHTYREPTPVEFIWFTTSHFDVLHSHASSLALPDQGGSCASSEVLFQLTMNIRATTGHSSVISWHGLWFWFLVKVRGITHKVHSNWRLAESSKNANPRGEKTFKCSWAKGNTGYRELWPGHEVLGRQL